MTTAPDLTAATARLALHHHTLLARQIAQAPTDGWTDEWRDWANPVALQVSGLLEAREAMMAQVDQAAHDPRPLEQTPTPEVEVPDQVIAANVSAENTADALQAYREVSTALKWLALQPTGVAVPEHIARVVERELRLHVSPGTHVVYLERERRWSIEPIAVPNPGPDADLAAGEQRLEPEWAEPVVLTTPDAGPAMMSAPADDPKPGLTGNSRDDLERMAAWSQRQAARRETAGGSLDTPPDLPAAAPGIRAEHVPTEAELAQARRTLGIPDPEHPATLAARSLEALREALREAAQLDPEHGLHRGQLVEQRIRAAFVLYLGPVYTSGLFVSCGEDGNGSMWIEDGRSIEFQAQTQPRPPTEHDTRTDQFEVLLAGTGTGSFWAPLEEFVQSALGTLGLL